MKRWKCTVCGQIFEGEHPPVPCPVCGAGEDAFILLDAPEVTMWKCTVCGQTFEGKRPPVPCPVCGAGEDAFIPVETQKSVFRRDTQERFVLIGGGGAALEAAKAIRARNQTASIVMIAGEGIIPHNRPALSDVVGDGYSFESIALEAYGWYESKQIRLNTHTRATGIDTGEKLVSLANGQKLPYDKLLLATGANPFNPIQTRPGDIPVRALRTFEDAMAIADACRDKRVIVVGGGILGLEAAVALRELNASVTVVELGERILSLQADADGSRRLKEALTAQGITIFTGKTVKTVSPTGATLTDGTNLAADFILVSIGVRSEVSLAREAGLAIQRGILVDEFMCTSAKDVYAAGDCAEFSGRVAGLWNTAMAQGAIAGAVMAGDESGVFAPLVPATAFETAGVSMFTAGTLGGAHLSSCTWQDGRTGALRRLYFDEKRLVGVEFLQDVSRSGAALTMIEHGVSFAESASLLGSS